MAQKKKSTIIHEGSDRPLQQKERHYVDNKKFYEALVKRKALIQKCEEDGLPIPRPDNYIGECIIKIAEGLQKKYNFTHQKYLPYKEEMIGDAIISCITYVDRFDPTASKNPFSYFTQTCYYAFIRRIEQEDDAIATRYKATIESAAMGELASLDSEEAEFAFQNLDVTMDNMEEFIYNYDAKQTRRKEIARKKKVIKKKGLEALMEDDSDE